MRITVVLCIVILCGLSISIPTRVYSASTKTVIREEVVIVIDGIEERWSLEWVKPPVPHCSPGDDDWMICPCNGFAYGERGDLELVRKRQGKEEERFSLTRLFEYGDNFPVLADDKRQAILMKWEPRKDDIGNYKLPGFIVEVSARPLAKIMNFGDYDHDGRATEFMLQIDTLPCGKRMSVIVGISRKNSQLHFFTSVTHPEEPLILQDWQWEALRRATGSISVVQWPCGDHGADGIDEYELRADNGNIFALKRQFQCNIESGQKGRLLGEEEF
jgi:hypothetical protein